MITYAIARADNFGSPLGFVAGDVTETTRDVGRARKYNAIPDAESFLRCDDSLACTPGRDHAAYLANLPETHPVVAILPWALAEAEAAAEWERSRAS